MARPFLYKVYLLMAQKQQGNTNYKKEPDNLSVF